MVDWQSESDLVDTSRHWLQWLQWLQRQQFRWLTDSQRVTWTAIAILAMFYLLSIWERVRARVKGYLGNAQIDGALLSRVIPIKEMLRDPKRPWRKIVTFLPLLSPYHWSIYRGNQRPPTSSWPLRDNQWRRLWSDVIFDLNVFHRYQKWPYTAHRAVVRSVSSY